MFFDTKWKYWSKPKNFVTIVLKTNHFKRVNSHINRFDDYLES